MEQTLIIIKPDGVCKKHVGDVIGRFEKGGLKVVALKMVHLNRKTAEGFYAVHKGKPFFEPFINFMISAPGIVMVLESENAVSRVRDIIGNTNSPEAKEGTLRKLYGTDNRRNLVHASESNILAKVEISYFFTDKEIHCYESGDWDK